MNTPQSAVETRDESRRPLQHGPQFELPIMSSVAEAAYSASKQIEMDPDLRPKRANDGFNLANIGGGQIDLMGDLGRITRSGTPMSATA